MGKFYNTSACVYDAVGNSVNFDTEYMYTSTGKKDPRIKALTAMPLIEIIVNDIINKLENHDA